MYDMQTLFVNNKPFVVNGCSIAYALC